MTSKETEILKKFIPENAIEQILTYQNEHPHQLKISRSRSTKLGDYRPPQGKYRYHRISVNGDLNKYSFLITYIHEIAHLLCWEQFGRNVKPHGQEWKNIYKDCLIKFIECDCFPEELYYALEKHINNPGASSCVDMHLQKELANYDENIAGVVYMENIPLGSHFVTRNGRLFVNLEKRRKRFKCKEIVSGKLYLFSPIAQVKPYSFN